MTATQDSINELAATLTRASRAYYNGRASGLTDHQFDQLQEQLREQDPDHPVLKTVGAPTPILTKVPHSIPMGSQNKAVNEREFRDWHTSLGSPALLASCKFDGFSLALYYDAGVLKSAVTRGDGTAGEDITANAVRFRGVPSTLPGSFTGAIRGEGLLKIQDWEAIDPHQESNPRNLAAGIARRKNGDQASSISFFAFDISDTAHPDHPSLLSEQGKIKRLSALGFEAPGQRVSTCQEAINYFEQLRTCRHMLPFWIDGVVFKVDDLAAQQKAGIVDNRPKGQIAWKFQAQEVTTVLEGVTVSVGHTGKIVPTARLQAVQIGGTTVTAASLHNYEEIERLDLAIGDVVVLIKAGDIIPAIVGRQQGRGAGQRIPIERPTHCPVCAGKVGPQTNSDGNDSAELYCLADDCPAKSIGKIRQWIASLDIKGIGAELLEAITQGAADLPALRPLVGKIADLYRLRAAVLADQEMNGRLLGAKRARSIIAEIANTRNLTIDQFLGSLGICHLGRRRVQLIRQAANLHCQGSRALEEIGGWLRSGPDQESFLIRHASRLGIPAIAGEIQAELDRRQTEIEELLELVTIISPKATARPVGGSLTGQSFCLTGSMSRPRKAIAEAIEAAGGTIKDDVASGLTALVQADPSSRSSKSAKAQSLRIPIITEKEMAERMGQH